jgi:hypothetical protein
MKTKNFKLEEDFCTENEYYNNHDNLFFFRSTYMYMAFDGEKLCFL